MTFDRDVRMAGVHAATRLRRQLGVRDDVPVDPFDAIRNLGLWLIFRPFEDLLGAMVREGVGGIAINPERPLGMQRFTAAHELGHWVMHDTVEATWDTVEELVSSSSKVEREAQAFASAFLMPPKLLAVTLRDAGISPDGDPTPQQVYVASREIGVSYDALVVELARSGRITPLQRSVLKKASVRAIKQSLGASEAPQSGAHIWTVGLEQSGAQLRLTQGDEVAVVLPENASTGYRWQFAAGHEGLQILEDHTDLPEDASIGAGAARRIVLRAADPGDGGLLASSVRAFDPSSSPVEEFNLSATIAPTPRSLYVQQLLAGSSLS